MIRRTTLAVTLIILLVLSLAAAVQAAEPPAQGETGSISGAVFRDVNANGLCTDEDEPGVTGIPVQLVFRENNSIVNLTSGGEGFFELASATVGTWQVTVNPGSGWRVTSQQTRQVVITEDEPDIEEIDFCIVQADATGGEGGGIGSGSGGQDSGVGGGAGQPVLPESGAPVSPGLISTAVLGLLLLLAGTGLIARNRKR